MNLRVFKTVRGKLTVAFTSVFGITLIIFSMVLYNIFASQSRSDFDFIMTALATSISETVKENGVNPDILSEIRELDKPGSTAYFGYIEVLNSTETAVIKSPQLEGAELPLSRNLIISALNGRKEFMTVYSGSPSGLWDNSGARILYFPAMHRQHKYVIVLVSPLASVEGMLTKLRLILYFTIPITLIVAAAAGWVFSRRAYAPVGELVNKANTITAEKLHSRLLVSDADDEISHLAETLNNMIERLEESFKTLKQFTSDASHELKTPLTIMRGEIEVSLKKARSATEYEDILKDNLEEVKRLQNIVEGLLMLSQYENRNIELRREHINLYELIIDAVTKSRIIALRKNIKLILKFEDENSESIFIRGDYQKLLNVFLNLIDNAVKYSNEFSEIHVLAGNDEIESTAHISIRDEGIGIPEESIKKIFERFYRADASRTRDENYSLGLGLSIAQAVIKAHNGKIKVKSESNKGTEFTVYLPAEDRPEPHQNPFKK